MSTNNKLEFYKSVAKGFTDTVKTFDSVKEVAIFASVAGNDPFPTDIDVALFVNSFDHTPQIAKAKRIAHGKMNGFDLFVFDEKRKFHGNICFRKECPSRSVDCSRPGCGDIPYIEKREGLVFDPVRWFKTPIEILYQAEPSGILAQWQSEILKSIGRSAPELYPLKESLFFKCRECGSRFEINPGEQKYFEKMDYDYPKRCQPCRDKELEDDIAEEYWD